MTIHSEDLREKVARIIEPMAFKTLREIAAAKGLDAANPPPGVSLGPIDTPRPERKAQREDALAKADQILSLISSIKEGGTEVLSAVAPLASPSVASRVPDPGPATPSMSRFPEQKVSP